jgi:hypothetical protein
MRKFLASLALSCAFVAALSVAASACEWQKQAAASTSDAAAQTAQQPPASADN